jgi:putative transcriptional regulator
MRETIKEAIGDTVQDLILSGIRTSFTEKELKDLGVIFPDVEIDASEIQEIRKRIRLSQNVFAKLLNVSPSSVRQWEQGKRKPSGSTMVLLDLLRMQPSILNYRIKASNLRKRALP